MPEETHPKIKSLKTEIAELRSQITALTGEREYFSRIFDYANDGIIIHDDRGRILEVNKTYYQRLGYDKPEMLKMSLGELVPPEFARLIPKRMKLLQKTGSAIFESQDRRKDGTFMSVEVSATYVHFLGRKVIQSVVRDIHNHKLAEELIKATMEDNARLLNEIQRQSRFISDTFTRILERILDCVDSGSRRKDLVSVLSRQRLRVANMAFVQGMLYRERTAGLIDLDIPIRKLIAFNFQQLRIHPCRVSPDIETGAISLDLSRAMPCCQLVTELLTNALLHAFPENSPGEVEIRLTQEALGGYILVVGDTGVGVPRDFSLDKPRTLGMQLVRDLVGQLQGTIELRRGGGTRFIVRFN